MLVDILGTTLVDYPGRVASTLFFAGCNFRCPFCHNAELVLPEKYATFSAVHPDALDAFLARRKGFITGVVLTGGEPLLSPQLRATITLVKSHGLALKLDTNGAVPSRLAEVIDEVDYVAMDIKAPLKNYHLATGTSVDPKAISTSVALIMDRARHYEFRTTLVPGLLDSTEDILGIGEVVRGAKIMALQTFRGEKTLDPDYSGLAIPTPDEVKVFAEVLAPFVQKVVLR